MVSSDESDKEQSSKVKAEGIIEYGIDSSERKFLKPSIKFDISLKFATYFAEISYYQRANSKMEGLVDYWLKSGLNKNLNDKTEVEVFVNHMCRHITLKENPHIYDLNELLGRINVQLHRVRFGLGLGTYLGGRADYDSLFIFHFNLFDVLNNKISLSGEFKWVDLKEIFHEIDLTFSLDKNVELFIRNAKHYELPNTTYIGLRTRTNGQIDKNLDSLKFTSGLYPFYDYHKMLLESEFRFEFFKKPQRRLIFSFEMNAPILRGRKFFHTFYPDEMVYPITLEYNLKLRKKLFLSWYNRYKLRLPLDVQEKYSSDLATGFMIRNQPDFDQNKENFKYEINAGYSFKREYDIGIKGGIKWLDWRIFNLFSELSFHMDNQEAHYSLRIYSDFGKNVSIRPFIQFDKKSFLSSQESSGIHILYGISLFKWFH